MKVLECLGVDEYYQTLNTWIKILDDKNEAMTKGTGGNNNDDGKQRRRLKGK
jgi:hypothetical protein